MPRRFDPDQPELMDVPQPPSAELERDLENLAGLNRWFGAHAIIRRFFARRLQPGARYRVLDLCTGGGDLPRLICRLAEARGCEVAIDAVDFQPGTVAIARRLCAAHPGINVIEADVLRFEPEPRGYDFALCCLALHHFSEADAARILEKLRGAARVAALAADLRRGALTTFGVWLITAAVYRDPMTKADGRASAARAFSFGEFAALAGEAGWCGAAHRRRYFGRQELALDCAGDSAP